jgi:hypothetical protein
MGIVDGGLYWLWDKGGLVIGENFGVGDGEIGIFLNFLNVDLMKGSLLMNKWDNFNDDVRDLRIY